MSDQPARGSARWHMERARAQEATESTAAEARLHDADAAGAMVTAAEAENQERQATIAALPGLLAQGVAQREAEAAARFRAAVSDQMEGAR